MRTIPTRNYAIVGVLILAISGVSIIVTSWIQNSRNISLMSGLLFEVKENELEHYLSETTNTIFYLASGSSQGIKPFEKDFKKIVQDNHIQTNLVYVNTDHLSDQGLGTFSLYLNPILSSTISTPNLILLEDGKITDLLYSKPSNMNIHDVHLFLKKHEVVK